jgi:hypothetical protein
MNGIHEVTGSIPVWSTKLSPGPSIGLSHLKAEGTPILSALGSVSWSVMCEGETHEV